jgi:serine/threonine protein kinase
MNWLREPDTEPLPGYVLVAPLGTGGFGEVWKCVAPGGIHKAIKFVYGNMNSLDDDSAKAAQEFKAMERVKAVRHPFVLSMERIDVVSGELLIVMELADKSLHDLLQERQAEGHAGLPRDRLLSYLSDSAEGLDHLIEKHNLQHLDVKPKNLFLIGERVKVADFGLVKHLERQSSSGLMGGITPVYAAPETFTNKISKHSDQYSLAVVFVEMLTGLRPFTGKNIRQLAMQHMTEPPDLSMLSETDRVAVGRALAKSPDDRWPSCLAFVRALGSADRPATETFSLEATPRPPRPLTAPDLDTSAATTSVPVPKLNRKTPPTIPAGLTERLIGQHLPRGAQLHQSPSMTVSFRPEEGVLRPAILIGVGSFGRRALTQVRCRLLDRVGDPSSVPCFRFLSLDNEPEADRKPRSAGDGSLLPEHYFSAPLQPATGYRRRHLDQLLEWLPREKFYAIPRSLRVGGSRALGRLAFADNYLRFVTRLRQEVQVATHPEAVSQSADHTGLPVRTKVPSVYVFASASGGTSGMLLDVGHAVRRTLERFNIPDAPVTAFVFTGAPEDPSTPPAEHANVFATLTELNHFADPEVKFAAQYGGPEGPAVEARGLPFHATYLLPMAERTSEAFRDCVAHLAGYVTHDLTTPLGTGLEKIRRATPAVGRTPFRGFGTFGVWYPRGLLLRSAARQLCARMMRGWAAFGRVHLPQEADRVLNAILDDARLSPEEVQRFVAAESAGGPDGNPAEATREWRNSLGGYAETAARRIDPQGWAVAAWDQCRDLVGLEPTTEADSPFRRGRLSRSLDLGLHRAADAWVNELTELVRPLGECAGPRLAIAEAVVGQVVASATAAAVAMEAQLHAGVEPRVRLRNEVTAALEACQSLDAAGGFNLFGSRAPKALRHVADRVKAFTDLRLKEDLAQAARQFYRRLQHEFEGRLHDLAAARARLTELAGAMEATVGLSPEGNFTPPMTAGLFAQHDADDLIQATLQESNTMRVVLPHGEEHLDRSAAEMLSQLDPAEQVRLELLLTRLVVEPRGGLEGLCRGSADLVATLAAPMVEQATTFLTDLTPAEDVTAVELAGAGNAPGELARRIASYARAAAPLAGGPASDERTFVIVPDTAAGRTYSEAVRATLTNVTTVPVRGTDTDLLYVREHGCLRTSDLHRVLEPCWEAYTAATETVEANPHARFDVTAWLPLVE